MKLPKVVRRAQRPVGVADQQTGLAESPRCSRAGCTSSASTRCRYVDGSGDGCGGWCSAHLLVVDGRALCERHRNVVRQMRGRAGTIYELKGTPALNDRRATLVSTIVEDLDRDIRRLLSEAFSSHADAQIATDPSVREGFRVTHAVAALADDSRMVATRRALTWTRGWAAYTNRGNLCRLTIEVPESEETEASLAVDGQVIFSGTPDVISGHRQTEPAAQLFRTGLLEALCTSLDGRGGPVRW